MPAASALPFLPLSAHCIRVLNCHPFAGGNINGPDGSGKKCYIVFSCTANILDHTCLIAHDSPCKMLSLSFWTPTERPGEIPLNAGSKMNKLLVNSLQVYTSNCQTAQTGRCYRELVANHCIVRPNLCAPPVITCPAQNDEDLFFIAHTPTFAFWIIFIRNLFTISRLDLRAHLTKS